MRTRKPSWLLWTIVVLLLLPVLYVASFGPACWLIEHGLPAGPPAFLYDPLLRHVLWGKGPATDALIWYGNQCGALGMTYMEIERGYFEMM